MGAMVSEVEGEAKESLAASANTHSHPQNSKKAYLLRLNPLRDEKNLFFDAPLNDL
jgi:hypothetical protein